MLHLTRNKGQAILEVLPMDDSLKALAEVLAELIASGYVSSLVRGEICPRCQSAMVPSSGDKAVCTSCGQVRSCCE